VIELKKPVHHQQDHQPTIGQKGKVFGDFVGPQIAKMFLPFFVLRQSASLNHKNLHNINFLNLLEP